MADLLTMPNQQLARRIISLSLRSNELSNAIQLFKEHLDKIRGEKARAIRLEQHSAQTRLKEQKSHYEGIVTRHQGFIEQVRCLIVPKTHSPWIAVFFFFLMHLCLAVYFYSCPQALFTGTEPYEYIRA